MLLFSPSPCFSSTGIYPERKTTKTCEQKNATKLLDRSVKRQQRGKGSRKHSAGKEWRADKAVHSIAFSVGGNRLSRLACPANNRERERGKLTRRKTHNNHRLCAYFSRAWPSDGTGVPLPLGNIVLCRRSPPSLSFFLFHLSDHRGRDPLRALQPHCFCSNPTTQPSLVRGGEEAGPKP